MAISAPDLAAAAVEPINVMVETPGCFRAIYIRFGGIWKALGVKHGPTRYSARRVDPG